MAPGTALQLFLIPGASGTSGRHMVVFPGIDLSCSFATHQALPDRRGLRLPSPRLRGAALRVTGTLEPGPASGMQTPAQGFFPALSGDSDSEWSTAMALNTGSPQLLIMKTRPTTTLVLSPMRNASWNTGLRRRLGDPADRPRPQPGAPGRRSGPVMPRMARSRSRRTACRAYSLAQRPLRAPYWSVGGL